MQKIINFLLALLKWPCAIGALFFIFPALKTDIVVLYMGLTVEVLKWFFLPLTLMIVIWLLVPGLGGSFLSILEHETTHMLFAVLTFHSPKDINIKRGFGGNFIYTGRGNWLISIAPYFFPTSAALVIGAGGFYAFFNQVPPQSYWLILGLMTGYHLISTLDEIHLGQTDFKAAGYLFSLLFLPGINLITYGLLMAYACHGFSGFSTYFNLLRRETRFFIELFL